MHFVQCMNEKSLNVGISIKCLFLRFAFDYVTWSCIYFSGSFLGPLKSIWQLKDLWSTFFLQRTNFVVWNFAISPVKNIYCVLYLTWYVSIIWLLYFSSMVQLVIFVYTLCPSCCIRGSLFRYFDKLLRHSIVWTATSSFLF